MNQFEPKLATLPEEVQKPTELRTLPHGMQKEAVQKSIASLAQLLLDSNMLFSLYKKHHWQLLGPTFYQLHLLFDKHAGEQLDLIDQIAERIQLLGGIAVAMPQDIAKGTVVPEAPQGAESVPAMITRLMEAHRVVIECTRKGIEITEENKDYGTNDLLMSDVLRTNELELWFISSHLSPTKLIAE